MHTGPKESATSLFVPPTNEQQYILLENLVGWHLTQWLDQGARETLALSTPPAHSRASMEIPFVRGPTADRQRGARSHPKNEF